MNKTAKVYIGTVVAVGASVLAASLLTGCWPDLPEWAIYGVLAVIASLVKLRLPGLEGTYSMGSLFVLYGVIHFSLPEVLVAACAGAAAGSLLNTKKRPAAIQVIFNLSGVALSASVAYFVGRVWLGQGVAMAPPVVIAAAGATYFISNTVLVSGVLALLEGKSLLQVCSQWYVWAFPYYLIGVALVGLLPSAGQAFPGEAWLIVLPLVYLVHFFVGLMHRHVSAHRIGDHDHVPMPRRASVYIAAVVATGAVMLVSALILWQSESLTRFAFYLLLALVASTLKVRLPRVQGTITPAFVLVLVTIAQGSFSEAVIVAILCGAVQVLWRPARRPMLAQVAFNPSSLAASAALAYGLSRRAPVPWLQGSVVGVLVVSTVVLYGCNTLLTAAVIALLNRRPLRHIWQVSYFWSLPYYLVGAAVAGAMTAVCQTSGWRPSLLLLPLMGLVFVSYRVHVQQVIGRKVLAGA